MLNVHCTFRCHIARGCVASVQWPNDDMPGMFINYSPMILSLVISNKHFESQNIIQIDWRLSRDTVVVPGLMWLMASGQLHGMIDIIPNNTVLQIDTWSHDDVIKRKHFPHYWPCVRGIHRSPVNSPHKGQWHGALVFSLICTWINSSVNHWEAGYLRRHRALHDVIVMDVVWVTEPIWDIKTLVTWGISCSCRSGVTASRLQRQLVNMDVVL